MNLNKLTGDPPELTRDNPASVPVIELGGNGGWNRWREKGEGADYKLGLMDFKREYDFYGAKVVLFSAGKRYDVYWQRKHLKTLWIPKQGCCSLFRISHAIVPDLTATCFSARDFATKRFCTLYPSNEGGLCVLCRKPCCTDTASVGLCSEAVFRTKKKRKGGKKKLPLAPEF